MDSFSHWQTTNDKGNLRYYRNKEFRDDYARIQLPKSQKMVYKIIKKEMHKAIMSTGRHDYEVLSLGCGPGSDCLAVMQVFQSACRGNSLDADRLTVNFTGVDKFDWPVNEFTQRRAAIELQGPMQEFPTKLRYNCDNEKYVDSVCNTSKRFDFIVLSYAEVKTQLALVSQRLPQLLRNDGEGSSRIFIVDNDKPQVLQLTAHGFQLVKRCNGTVCLMFDNDQEDSSSESGYEGECSADDEEDEPCV